MSTFTKSARAYLIKLLCLGFMFVAIERLACGRIGMFGRILFLVALLWIPIFSFCNMIVVEREIVVDSSITTLSTSKDQAVVFGGWSGVDPYLTWMLVRLWS